MEKIEKEYIINIDETISNFRAELAADTKNVRTTSSLEHFIGSFKPDTGASQDLSLAWRKSELTKLYNSLVKNKEKILDAIVSDYNIAREEAEIYDYNPVLFDVEKLANKYESWLVNQVDLAAEELGRNNFETLINGVKSNLGFSTAPQSKVINTPYGVSLILGSQKSDLSTLLKPVAASIAAGNYTIVKPNVGKGDNYVTKTDLVVTQILKESLDSTRSIILDDDYDFMDLIENHKVDLVFTRKNHNRDIVRACGEAGVIVKQHSAGWNVGIVSKFANVKEAAELLIHNKFYKSGQHLDNVDVIYVDKAVYNSFLIESKNALYKFYTSLGQKNLNYGTMSSKKDFNHILELLSDPNLDSSQYLTSVFHSVENLRINPILILNPSPKSEIMQKKIYGPILPIVTFDDPFDIQEQINNKPHVENLFYFGENSRVFPEIKTLFQYQNLFFNGTNFGVLGGGLGPDYGTDGTMESGLGGRFGIMTFSQQKTFMNPGSMNAYLSGGAQKDFIKNQFNFGVRKGFGRFLTKGNLRNSGVGIVGGFILSRFV